MNNNKQKYFTDHGDKIKFLEKNADILPPFTNLTLYEYTQMAIAYVQCI